ncbi:MAG: ThiF family adenylyltransferase [Planctomycetes bacterium]|nr:ThiF family adenylyltransferase [Planctomycetota bacterium]
MNREELFRRTREVLRPEVAREWVVLVCGVGSGGARVAEELVRFGTGTVLLVDRPEERLEEHNLIRHPLGYGALGRRKLDAMRERLLDIHPACGVETHGLDVLQADAARRLDALVRRAHVVALATDGEASKHVVNDLCVRAGVPMVFAGVFDGGVGGEVGRVLPRRACYACIASMMNPQGAAAAPAGEAVAVDYSHPVDDARRSTAALNLDIATVALAQARVLLATLLARQDPASDAFGEDNYFLFGNRPVPRLFDRAFQSDFLCIAPRPDCLVCGRAGPSEAEVESRARAILREAGAVERTQPA